MKLLILLITLLARSNLSLSMPKYREIQENLETISKGLKENNTVFTHSINITTPRRVKNVCKCDAQFEKHLSESVNTVFDHLPEFYDRMANILDTLNGFQPTPEINKGSNNSCNFHEHTVHNLNEVNNTFIKDNIHFIQKWNVVCRSTESHKKQ